MIHWLQHETGGLLLLCAAAIAVLLALIIWVRLEPFIALIVSSLALALAAGLPVSQIVGTALSSKTSVLETGFGLGHNFLATWQAWRGQPPDRRSAGPHGA